MATPLIPPPPLVARLDRRKVLAGALVACGAAGTVLAVLLHRPARPSAIPAATTMAAESVEAVPTLSQEMERTNSYAKLNLVPPSVPPPTQPAVYQPDVPSANGHSLTPTPGTRAASWRREPSSSGAAA